MCLLQPGSSSSPSGAIWLPSNSTRQGARELGVDVEIICADLSDEAGLATVLGAIRNADPMIDLSSIARELEQPVHSSICHRPIPT